MSGCPHNRYLLPHTSYRYLSGGSLVVVVPMVPSHFTPQHAPVVLDFLVLGGIVARRRRRWIMDRIMLRHCRKAPPSVAEVIIDSLTSYLLLGMHSDIMSRFCCCCAQLNMHYCLHHKSTYRWRSSHQGTVAPNQVFPICAKHDNPFGRNLPSTVIRRCIPASPLKSG